MTDIVSNPHEEARLIAQALPYMQRYENRTVVVKYGGHAMGDPKLAKAFARDIALLKYDGQGFILTQKRMLRGLFKHWPTSPNDARSKMLLAHELHILLWGGDPATGQIALDADAEVVWSSSLGQVDPWWDCCPVRVDREEGVIIVEDPVRLLHHDPATGELLDAEVTGRAEDVTDRNPGLGNPSVWYPHEDVEVVASDGGHRLDVRTADGAVTIRSDRTIRVESIDPLVVADEREVLGVTRAEALDAARTQLDSA
jgi:hypothetical protein